ncbi:hypothetical protein FRC02_010449 [Tulasnella sp. 418]|nr:hypothetical protein FRC02_010449 [Tulasnella sp. 418]
MSYDPVARGPSPAGAANNEVLAPPQAPGIRDSIGTPSNVSYQSEQAINIPYRDDPQATASGLLNEKDGGAAGYPPAGSPSGEQGKKRKPLFWILVGIAILAIIVLAVILPVYFKVIKPNNASAESQSSTSGGGSNGGGSGGGNNNGGGSNGNNGNSDSVVFGSDGTTVTTEDGSTFVYKNSFGGYFAVDPNNPFYDGARAQSWSPPLNETWDYNKYTIRGVNLGGWLNTEPFISPALFQKYAQTSSPAIDEWGLSEHMAQDPEGLKQLEDHYRTFITEEDFAMIAGAGLNWIRLPIPYWCIEKFENEPFLEGVCWKYALKAFDWARKYGLRINLDLHAIPGSQNGYNHSGKKGTINFLHGVMGVANAQRALNHIRILTEFITQPEYANVIPIFGVINEARTNDIGKDQITSFYLHMHDMIRSITGYGAGKGPWIAIHDGFQNLRTWEDFLPGRDRVSMDTHTYLCFTSVDTRPLEQQLTKPCTAWAKEQNTSWTNFGVTSSGEWSLAINDCGLYLNGVGSGTRWEGTLEGYTGTTGSGGCGTWNDYESWDQSRKDGLKQFALASMDALQNWFFWTWKIGPSLESGKVEAPLWSYRLGLENGWMPTDPRQSVGVCGGANPAPPLTPAMVGEETQQFTDALRQQFPWPPLEFPASTGQQEGPSRVVSELPTYTPTGTIPILAMPTHTMANGKVFESNADGWFSEDKTPVYVPVQGCTYPNQWDALNVDVPPTCTGSGSRRVRGVKGVLLETHN